MTAELFVIAALSTWRITSLLVFEKGPWDVFTHVRTLAARWQTTSDAFACPWCLSVYVAVLVYCLAVVSLWPVLVPFALSAVAILIERIVREQRQSERQRELAHGEAEYNARLSKIKLKDAEIFNG